YLTLLLLLAVSHATYLSLSYSLLFFFTPPSPSAFYSLSLHDALPISFLVLPSDQRRAIIAVWDFCRAVDDAVDEEPSEAAQGLPDRKSTRLNSSHVAISYAVFCLKKKKIK